MKTCNEYRKKMPWHKINPLYIGLNVIYIVIYEVDIKPPGGLVEVSTVDYVAQQVAPVWTRDILYLITKLITNA